MYLFYKIFISFFIITYRGLVLIFWLKVHALSSIFWPFYFLDFININYCKKFLMNHLLLVQDISTRVKSIALITQDLYL